MSNKLYPESCPDVYPKNWTQSQFQAQLDSILYNPNEQQLSVKNHEFSYLSLIERIIQVISGLLGFGNQGDSVKVTSELLKLLYTGATHGHLKESTIKRLQGAQYNLKSPLSHRSVVAVVNDIWNLHNAKTTQAANDSLKKMRTVLEDYHKIHAKVLQPHFWFRFFENPSINPKNLINFGDAPLELAKRACEKENYAQAFNFLLQAHSLKNKAPYFQEKFWNQFKAFLEKNFSIQTIKNRSNEIQNTIYELATTAFQNNNPSLAEEQLNFLLSLIKDKASLKEIRLRMGEIYINFSQIRLVEPFLQILKQHYTQNIEMLTKIADAYWSLQRIPDAILVLDDICKLYEIEFHTYQIGNKIVDIKVKIGTAYLNNQVNAVDQPGELSDNYENAIKYLSEAFVLNEKNKEIQQKLSQAFIQQFNQTPKDFEKRFGKTFVTFLDKCDASILNENKTEIQKMAFLCAEVALTNNKPIPAKKYVERVLNTFDNDPEFVSIVIDLFLKYQASKQLYPFMKGWLNHFNNNFIIFEKIGNIFSANKEDEASFETHEKALTYYEKQLLDTSISDETRTYALERVEVLGTKVNAYLLKQTTYWGSNSKEQEVALRLLSDLEYQKRFVNLFIQQWKASPENFGKNFGERFLIFMEKAKLNAFEKNDKELREITLACVQEALKFNKFPMALKYAERYFAFSEKDAEFILKFINQFIQNKSTIHLSGLLNSWLEKFSHHVIIIEKIGNILDFNQKVPQSIEVFKKALKLYEKRLTQIDISEQDRKTIQVRAADLRIKIAEYLFKQTSWWGTKSPEQQEAIDLLKVATKENPIHAKELAKKFRALGVAEKEKSVITRDDPKVVQYFRDSYELDPIPGDYLKTLIELYFKLENNVELMSLYIDIQSHPWASEVKLTAEQYYKLAQFFNKGNSRENSQHILDCLKNACKLDTKNTTYKRDFAQFTLTITQDKLKKISAEKSTEKNVKLQALLDELEIGKQFGLESFKDLSAQYAQTAVTIHRHLMEPFIKQFEVVHDKYMDGLEALAGENFQSTISKKADYSNANKHHHLKISKLILEFYDKAIAVDPSDATLHFDKGVMLEITGDIKGALESLRLAVKHATKENPFYYYLLSLLCSVNSEGGNEEMYFKKIPYDNEDHLKFREDYEIWQKQCLKHKKEEPIINPHDYSIITTGTFSTTRKLVLPTKKVV
ncbi:MAG: hypothetical protein H0W88_09595 [Parachlamydiaceae bacterium]|nr:hypothetical protein [Parachlamydiaceae bacterium]